VVRAPKKKPKNNKGTSEATPPVPKWIPGWQDAKDADLPAWARKSYAQVVAAKADAAEAKPEGSEREGEETGSAPASPDKAAGRPASQATARGMSRPAAEVDLAQFAVLLPGLLQMLTAFQEGKLTAGARPMPVAPAIPGAEEPQSGPSRDKSAAGVEAAKEVASLPEGYGPVPLTAPRPAGPYTSD
jgi:hypothetical protein